MIKDTSSEQHLQTQSDCNLCENLQEVTKSNMENSSLIESNEENQLELSKHESIDEQQLLQKIPQCKMNKFVLTQQLKAPKLKMFNIILRYKYIMQFISNLYLNAYIVRHNERKLLEKEKYLSNYKTESFQQNDESKSQSKLQPGSKLLIIANCYILLIQFLSLWLSPLLFCFDNNIQHQQFISLIMILSIGFDIFVSLNKAIIIFDQGEIKFDKKFIRQSYTKSQLLQDLIMILVWLYYYLNQSYISYLSESIFLISTYVNMKKLRKNYFYYLEHIYLKGGINKLIDLATLIFLIYFYVHFMACFWHYIGNMHQYFETTWLIKYNLHDKSMWVKYNYSFYWGTVSMATISYGDITPQNQLEVLFSSLMILISTFFYVYLITSAGIIIKNFNKHNFRQRQDRLLISNYMKKNQVNQNTQYLIKNYLIQHSDQEYENQDELNLVLDRLPQQLKLMMTDEIQNKLINKITLLKQNFSQQLLKSLLEQVKRQRYAPGDLIYIQNNKTEQNLYFILEGNVELIEINSKFQLQQLKDNQFFGEYQFFTGFPPKTSAISRSYSEIIKINRDSMMQILSSFQNEQQRFQQIQDSILNGQSYKIIQLKCSFCQKFNHQSIDCKRIQYKPDVEYMIKRVYFSKNQERRYFRRQKNKLNTLHIQKILLKQTQKFQKKFIDSTEIFNNQDNQEKYSENIDKVKNYNNYYPDYNSNEIIKKYSFFHQKRKVDYENRNPDFIQYKLFAYYSIQKDSYDIKSLQKQ